MFLSHELLLEIKILLKRMRPVRSGAFIVRFVADGNDLRSSPDLRFGFVDLDLDVSLLLNLSVGGLVFVSFLF